MSDKQRLIVGIISGLVQTGVPMTPLAGTVLGYLLIGLAGILSIYIFFTWARTGPSTAELARAGLSISKSPATRFALIIPSLFLIAMAIVWSYFGGLPALLSQPIAKPTITWGFGVDICTVRTDSAAFLKFKEEYRIVAVCGVDSPSVDRYEDRNITVSEAFTITSNPISISVLLNEKTLQAHLERLALEKKSHSLSPIPGKPNLQLMVSGWGQLVLIPKSATPNDIKKLSDVPVYKGKILSPDDI